MQDKINISQNEHQKLFLLDFLKKNYISCFGKFSALVHEKRPFFNLHIFWRFYFMFKKAFTLLTGSKCPAG